MERNTFSNAQQQLLCGWIGKPVDIKFIDGSSSSDCPLLGFDQFSVAIKDRGKPALVFKHAIGIIRESHTPLSAPE